MALLTLARTCTKCSIHKKQLSYISRTTGIHQRRISKSLVGQTHNLYIIVLKNAKRKVTSKEKFFDVLHDNSFNGANALKKDGNEKRLFRL